MAYQLSLSFALQALTAISERRRARHSRPWILCSLCSKTCSLLVAGFSMSLHIERAFAGVSVTLRAESPFAKRLSEHDLRTVLLDHIPSTLVMSW
jgi:hypothetical protein